MHTFLWNDYNDRIQNTCGEILAMFEINVEEIFRWLHPHLKIQI